MKSSPIHVIDCPHTDFASNAAVQSREDKIAVLELFRGTLSHYQLSQLFRHGQRLLPVDRILVFLASRSLRSSYSVKGKVWV